MKPIATKSRNDEGNSKSHCFCLHSFVRSWPHFGFVALLILAGATTGCQQDAATAARKVTVPDDAKVIAEGTGTLKYRALQDGRIFVFDVEDQLVDTARHVRAGQDVVVDPASNTATLDGRKIVEQLKVGHTHRLYFLPE